ncbi:MBL fold metallo-hydrolase [Candidatus Roizmanbacteria bacterium]|nr:MBL fold metallo-hydrolase [Candidatus Roizmanbacteria bacterium]
MDIKYLGHASFFLRSKDAKLVTDPFDPEMTGLKFPKVEADIVTVSHHHHDHDMISLVQDPLGSKPLVVDMPGEVEKLGMRIFGYQSYHDRKKGAERGENNLYKITDGEISVLHCGDLGVVLDNNFVDQIGDVDVLLVPVGGFFTMSADEAVELVKKIEPYIVIPMHYNHAKLNQKTFGELTSVDYFLKKIGSQATTPVPRLTVKKGELGDETKVVVMEICCFGCYPYRLILDSSDNPIFKA